MKVYVLFLISIIMIISKNVYSGNGVVVVRYADETGKPLTDVSLQLIRTTDTFLTKIAITDSLGEAIFDQVEFSTYIVIANTIGYEIDTSEAFLIDSLHSVIQLKTTKLMPVSNQLEEASIVFKKPFIERYMDKLIVNVENSIASAGSSVLDVLARSPGVLVNNGNSIQLRGKSGVLFMFDGKPTPLAGEDLVNYLKTIPAANVDKIEIITQPSARYDAGGNAGIINIRFKKDKNLGFNGSATMSLGQGVYFKPTLSTNLNYRTKKINVFGSYSFNKPRDFTQFDINRKFFDANQNIIAVFDQKSYIKTPILSNNAKLGLDVYLNSKTVIGAVVNGNISEINRDGFTSALTSNAENVLLYTTETENILTQERENVFANLNLKHTFDSTAREITVDLDYGFLNSINKQSFLSRYIYESPYMISTDELRTDQKGGIYIYSAKTDYIHPLKKQAKLEAGFKSSFVRTDNEIAFYTIVPSGEKFDSTRSNHFVYDENINAGYFIFSKELKKVNYQLGLRAEHTTTSGKQITTDQLFSRNYLYFFPSASINYVKSETHQFSWSYSRRIDRPSYQQLNPFRVFVDPYTYVVGDQQLKPVLTHSFDFSYTLMGQYIGAMGYAKSKETITDVFVQDDSTKISYQTPANLQDYDQVYLSFSIPFSLKNWLNSSLLSNIYWNRYSSPFLGGNLRTENVSYDIYLNNSFVMGKKGWSAELSGMYQAGMVWGLFYIKGLAQISAGVQKVSANKMSVFKLSVTDITYMNRIRVVVQYQNQDFFTNRQWDSRVLTFTYVQRFGKTTVAQARKRSTGVEDVKRRTN